MLGLGLGLFEALEMCAEQWLQHHWSLGCWNVMVVVAAVAAGGVGIRDLLGVFVPLVACGSEQAPRFGQVPAPSFC